MKIINGDILDVKDGYICYPVTCKGAMPVGLVKRVMDEYPEVFKEYNEKVDNRKKSLSGDIQLIPEEDGKIFVNMFSQDDCGCVGYFTSHEAFEQCLAKLKEVYNKEKNVYFAYRTGCDIGGGNWETISGLIEKYFPEAIIIKK